MKIDEQSIESPSFSPLVAEKEVESEWEILSLLSELS